MARCLIVFLAVFALAAAMVPYPRYKRALHEDDNPNPDIKIQTTTQETVPKICQPTTPCQWIIYKVDAKYDTVTFKNTYCTCKEGTTCQFETDDGTLNSYIYNCKSPPTLEPDHSAN